MQSTVGVESPSAWEDSSHLAAEKAMRGEQHEDGELQEEGPEIEAHQQLEYTEDEESVAGKPPHTDARVETAMLRRRTPYEQGKQVAQDDERIEAAQFMYCTLIGLRGPGNGIRHTGAGRWYPAYRGPGPPDVQSGTFDPLRLH